MKYTSFATLTILAAALCFSAAEKVDLAEVSGRHASQFLSSALHGVEKMNETTSSRRDRRFLDDTTTSQRNSYTNRQCEVDTFNIIGSEELSREIADVTSQFEVLTFADFCNETMDWTCDLDYERFNHDVKSVCHASGGLYFTSTYLLTCEGTRDQIPSLSYQLTNFPDCSGTSCVDADLQLIIENLQKTLEKTVEDGGSWNCTSKGTLVGYNEPDISSISPKNVCPIVEAEYRSILGAEDDTVDCICSQDPLTFGIRSTCVHDSDTVCMSTSGDIAPFEGKYSLDVALNVDSNGEIFTVPKYCFQYAHLHGKSKVCVELDTAGSCIATVNDDECTSCNICNAANSSVTVDCSNHYPDQDVMSGCESEGVKLTGTILSFLDKGIVPSDGCQAPSATPSSAPTSSPPISPSSMPSLRPTSEPSSPPSASPASIPKEQPETETTTDNIEARCPALPIPSAAAGTPDMCQHLMKSLALRQSCDCYHFCNGELHSCTNFGDDEGMTDITCANGELVTGCTFAMLDFGQTIQEPTDEASDDEDIKNERGIDSAVSATARPDCIWSVLVVIALVGSL